MTREENALKLRHKHYNFKDDNNGSSKIIFIVLAVCVLGAFFALFS